MLLVVLLALLGLVGCKDDAQFGGQQREKNYATVISLSPSTTEIVCQMGLQNRLKGRTSSCDFPPSLGSVPIVVNGTKPDYERIKSYNPALIVLDETLYGADDLAKIKELGIETAILSPTSLDNVLDYYAQIGMLVGNEQGASDFIDRVFATRETALGNMGESRVPSMVLIGGGPDYMVAGSQTYVADAVRAAGGEFLGPEAKLFVAINPEEIIRLNPQVVFMPKGDAEKFLADSRFASVSAVKNRRVYPTDSGVLLRPGSRIDKLIQAMSAVLQNAKQAA